MRGRDATAACGCHTDTCAGTLTVRPGASVLAGAEVRHMARQPRCGLGVKMALGAMPAAQERCGAAGAVAAAELQASQGTAITSALLASHEVAVF